MIQIPMTPKAWTFDSYSNGVGRHPLADGAGWMFNFPAADGVHYLTCSHGAGGRWDLSGSATVTIEGVIDQIGDTVPVFAAAGGGIPACRLLLERAIDVSRYWSNPVELILAPGRFTLTVPLTPDQWSNVDGKSGTQTLPAFNTLLHHVGVVGMTFGGMFFGHGAWCSQGKADFRCHSCLVN
jgi:hypothetical protein